MLSRRYVTFIAGQTCIISSLSFDIMSWSISVYVLFTPALHSPCVLDRDLVCCMASLP